MLEIKSMGDIPPTKNNPLGAFWSYFASLDKFTKFYISIFALVIIVTPFIVSNKQIFNPKAEKDKTGQVQGPEKEGKFVKDEILVKFKSDVSEDLKRNIIASEEATEKSEIPRIKVKVLKVREDKLEETLQRLSNHPNVEFAEKNYLGEVDAITPNDPQWVNQWQPQRVKAPEAWDKSTGSGVVVAALDTGVYANHEDLQGQLVAGFDIVNNDNQPDDDHWADEGHGTPVTGVIAAITNNAKGVGSIAHGSKVMPVKICDFEGMCSFSNAASGVIWAVDHGAKIINMSFGQLAGSATLESAIKYAWDSGAILFAGAGNCGCGTMRYPAKDPLVMGVSGINESNEISRYSSYASEIDIAAPSEFLILPSKAGGYAWVTGTSFASPAVAAVAALVWSANPTLTNQQIRSILETTAVDLMTPGWDHFVGHGLVDAQAAVNKAQNPSGQPPTSTPTPTPTSAPSTSLDSDGDGFTDIIESYIGTSPSLKCQVSSSSTGPNSAWPPDVNGNDRVNRSDAEAFEPYINKKAGQAGFNVRFDLNKNGVINGQDVLILNKYMGKTCQ